MCGVEKYWDFFFYKPSQEKMIPSDRRLSCRNLILIPLDFWRKFSHVSSPAGKITAIRRAAVWETNVSRQVWNSVCYFLCKINVCFTAIKLFCFVLFPNIFIGDFFSRDDFMRHWDEVCFAILVFLLRRN